MKNYSGSMVHYIFKNLRRDIMNIFFNNGFLIVFLSKFDKKLKTLDDDDVNIEF